MANRIAGVQTKNGMRKSSNAQPQSGNWSGNMNDEIAKLAYQFFLERGGEHGHDQEDWARAEAIIKKRRS